MTPVYGEGRKLYRERRQRRNPWKVFLIALAVFILLVLAACQTMTAVLYDQSFGHRVDSTDTVPKFEAYPDLEQRELDFSSNKGQNLKGYYYWEKGADSFKAVVVLSHGYGGMHRHYLSQIDYLAQNGYLVYAFDKTGVDESEGQDVRGMPQGVIDLQYALDTVRNDEISGKLPLFLYGHSWGAFSSCAVLEYAPDVKAVVSFSGFNKSKDMLIDQGISMYGDFVGMMGPFLTVCDVVRFGSHAFDSSEKGLAATSAEVLLFHSDDDPVITIEDSFDLYQRELGDKPNLHFSRMEGRGHNIAHLNHELDPSVMRQIVDFYDGVVTVHTDTALPVK